VDQSAEDVNWFDTPGRLGTRTGGARRRDWDVKVDAAVRAAVL
jgi:hypothetical protein